VPITVTVSSSQGTFPGGTYQIGPLLIASPFASMQTTAVAFTGAQSVTVAGPVGATAVIIEPPTGNVVQLTLKGIAGDNGIPISANLSCGPLPFFNPAVANSIVLTSAGAITGVVTVTFV
jgi:hypothetical protein